MVEALQALRGIRLVTAATIMVGDRHHDVDGAHAQGVRAVGALWGYGVGDELRTAGADWLARDVAACGRVLGV